jgi:hypothetical protein
MIKPLMIGCRARAALRQVKAAANERGARIVGLMLVI